MPISASLPVNTSTRATPAFGWRSVCRSRHAHQTADRLHQEVIPEVVRTRTASEAGNRGIDYSRVRFPTFLVTETVALHRPGPKVLDHDIGALHKLSSKSAIRSVGQIKCQ